MTTSSAHISFDAAEGWGEELEDVLADDDIRRTIRTLATQVAEIYQDHPDLKAAVMRVDGAVGDLERRVHSLEHENRKRRQQSRPDLHLNPRTSSISTIHIGDDTYDPEMTPAGGMRLDMVKWEELQRKFEDTEKKLAIQEAEKRGAEQAKEKAEKDAKRLQGRIVFYVTLMGAIGAGLAWALTHIFHI